MTRTLSEIIKRPLITEKASLLVEQNRYSFAVVKEATKTQIKKAVEKFFQVKVLKVQTIMVRGKKRRVGKTKRMVKSGDWKKAIVQLVEGDKIDLFAESKK